MAVAPEVWLCKKEASDTKADLSNAPVVTIPLYSLAITAMSWKVPEFMLTVIVGVVPPVMF